MMHLRRLWTRRIPRWKALLAAVMVLLILFYMRFVIPSAVPPSDVAGINTNHHPTRTTRNAMYSSVRCIDQGADTFHGLSGVYGFSIVNRSCLYRDVYWDGKSSTFIYHAEDTPENRDLLMRKQPILTKTVNLASRPYDLPILHRKRVIIKRKVGWTFEFVPEVRLGPLPVDLVAPPKEDQVYGYYTPIVAPWNFAHTLFCDLFPLFWMLVEFGLQGTLDLQVLATSSHYHGDFPLPNKNKAFDMFSRLPPKYDIHLQDRQRVPLLLVGSGTKSWSWVTSEYSASGSVALWAAFRQHVIDVTNATDQSEEHTIRTSICHKKDKRGVVNYDEAVQFLQNHSFAAKGNKEMVFVLEGAVGRSAKEQVEMMLRTDIFLCNEGTLATSLFLLKPGSVFVSIPLVYHGPHLHQRKMPPAEEWWRLPDPARPDPRKNTGGNIDWFPPVVRWVKTMWYDQIPLKETKIQTPLIHLRNYMPDMNVVLQERRLVPLLQRAISFLDARQVRWHTDEVTGEIQVDVPDPAVDDDGSAPRPPNYSVNAALCRDMMLRNPNLTSAFNSARCYYGMSWLCEFWSNTRLKWRIVHEKWSLSKGRCGGRDTALEHLPMLVDPRMTTRSLSEYLYFTREELRKSYTTFDLGNFTKVEDELKEVFG